MIATVGQLFCGAAGLTSASRTWYAFSRDRGDAGLGDLPAGQPRPGAVQRGDRRVSVFSLIIAIPALFGKNNIPFAFFAITGICTVGLYIAYIIPVYLRLRAGDASSPGRGTSGGRYRLVNTARDHLRDPGRVRPRPALHAGRPAVERRLRRERRQLHAAGDPAAADLRRLVAGRRPRTTTRVRCARSRRTRSRATDGRMLTLDELKKAVEDGTRRHRAARIADMEGRLQGKRLTAAPLPRRGGRARRRGLQLPARRGRRHGHRRRLRDVALGRAATATS